MIKLSTIILESNKLDEGWKENILATALSVAGFFSNASAKTNYTDSTTISQNISDSLTVPMGTLFASGRYLFNPSDKAITEKLKLIGNYIQKNPNSNFDIEIISSESLVPNYDAEKPGKVKLQSGELAQKRAEVAKYTISIFMEDLKKEGILKGNTNFINPQILIGKTPYTPGEDPRQDKFTKEQYVNVIIKAKTQKTTNNYSIFAENGDEMYDENKQLIGMVFYSTIKSNKINNAGNINTSNVDVLFRKVKPNTSLIGNKSEKGVYTQDYIIPGNEWNRLSYRTGNVLSQDNLKTISKYLVK